MLLSISQSLDNAKQKTPRLSGARYMTSSPMTASSQRFHGQCLTSKNDYFRDVRAVLYSSRHN